MFVYFYDLTIKEMK